MNHKRLRCRLGIHDWHVLEATNKYSVEVEVAEELDPVGSGEFRVRGVSYIHGSIHRKACVCCGKVSDEIAKYRMKLPSIARNAWIA